MTLSADAWRIQQHTAGPFFSSGRSLWTSTLSSNQSSSPLQPTGTVTLPPFASKSCQRTKRVLHDASQQKAGHLSDMPVYVLPAQLHGRLTCKTYLKSSLTASADSLEFIPHSYLMLSYCRIGVPLLLSDCVCSRCYSREGGLSD